MIELYLCSQSPRRAHLLSEAGISFHSLSVKVSEIPKKNLNLTAQIEDIAARKAKSGIERLKYLKVKDYLVLSADTVVLHNGLILGKPKSIEEAILTLSQLSGRAHKVMTSVCLADSQSETCFSEVTEVTFKTISDLQIKKYVETGEPFDKAGAYGIQGQAREFVDSFNGSFSNVVGLPMEKLIPQLLLFGIGPKTETEKNNEVVKPDGESAPRSEETSGTENE